MKNSVRLTDSDIAEVCQVDSPSVSSIQLVLHTQSVTNSMKLYQSINSTILNSARKE